MNAAGLASWIVSIALGGFLGLAFAMTVFWCGSAVIREIARQRRKRRKRMRRTQPNTHP